ncbi:putative protein PTGES3L [Clupea harengus]|uniref:CS domain-containing protein n=1 Tax=Clupea harengus TaxID=7950 RepID=A0A6P3VJC8_CLUHA|nr:putative protein PTGES3L [Clupea harengus]
MPQIKRPADGIPARCTWFDRKKYVTVNFNIQHPRELQCEITEDKVVLCCKDADDNVIYNEFYFYDKIMKNDSRERPYDRTVNLLLRKWTPDVAWPRLTKDLNRPSWMAVDFDNWRDWENEEEDGREEFEHYADMMHDLSKKGAAPTMDDLDFDDD